MRVDGLVYFVAMTIVNALNMLILLKATQPIVQGLYVVIPLQSFLSFLTESQRGCRLYRGVDPQSTDINSSERCVALSEVWVVFLMFHRFGIGEKG